MVTNYDGEQVEIPENLPMLPVREIVVFPYMIIPLFVGRDSSIKSVEEALSRTDRFILLASEKEISDQQPSRLEAEALMRTVREQLERVISLGKVLSPDILMVLDDIQDPGRLADLVA